jgi:hypothetical protein
VYKDIKEYLKDNNGKDKIIGNFFDVWRWGRDGHFFSRFFKRFEEKSF